MKTNKFLAVGLLATLVLSSCSNSEDPALVDSGTNAANEIEVKAGIGLVSRAVIDSDYNKDLKIAFVRSDGNVWTTPLSHDAIRVGGSGNTSVVFTETQEYATNGTTTLVGYYPRAAVAPTSVGNVATVKYTITGDEDIMATQSLSASKNPGFTTPFTFQHMLGQLQFKCIGSSGARDLWKQIAIKVTGVPRDVDLKLDRTKAAVLSSAGNNGDLDVKSCPAELSMPEDADPATGYLMLYPAPNLGAAASINLAVTGQYDGNFITRNVSISNIDGGVQPGVSHMITLVFTKDGEISATATADIAPWRPGNSGGTVVKPN